MQKVGSRKLYHAIEHTQFHILIVVCWFEHMYVCVFVNPPNNFSTWCSLWNQLLSTACCLYSSYQSQRRSWWWKAKKEEVVMKRRVWRWLVPFCPLCSCVIPFFFFTIHIHEFIPLLINNDYLLFFYHFCFCGTQMHGRTEQTGHLG